MINTSIGFCIDNLSIYAHPVGVPYGTKIDIVKVTKDNYDEIMGFVNQRICLLTDIKFYPLFCYINEKKEIRIICKPKDIGQISLLERLNPNLIPSLLVDGIYFNKSYKKDKHWGPLLERLPMLFLKNEDEIRECYEHLPISEESFIDIYNF